MHPLILGEIQKSSALLLQILNDQNLLKTVDEIASCCVRALEQGKKILFAGNGGSAADSQHLAAELAVRIKHPRRALAAIALTTDTSALTAIGNDFGFEQLFARQIEAIGQAGDVFIAISISGKSPNILRALEAAKVKSLRTVGFSGVTAPMMVKHCEWVLNIPSVETPKIQECHILFGHIICSVIEAKLFGFAYEEGVEHHASSGVQGL